VGTSAVRKFGVALVLVLLGVAALFVATYERGNGEPEASPPSTFPPGTITPTKGDEIDCGEYTWPIDLQLDDETADRFAEEHGCFLEALAAGTPAVIVEHSSTTEGDPVRSQFRVTGPNAFEMTHDSTLDNFSDRTVYTVSCTGAEVDDSRLDPLACESPPD
jgi:hypothetical protein